MSADRAGGRGRRSPSLLMKFGALSLVLLVAFGVVLNTQISRSITHRSLLNSERSAAQLVDFVTALASTVDVGPSGVPTAAQASLLKSSFDSYARQGLVAGVDAYLVNGLVPYSDDPALVGKTLPLPPQIAQAFQGHRRVEVVRHSDNAHLQSLIAARGPMFVLYNPVRFGEGSRVVASVALYVPYQPIADGISQDTRRVTLLLVIGFGVLYLGLFQLVFQASRRLRRTARENQELATHDALTGLPNRTLLHDRVAQALSASGRTGHHPALLLLDLDRFKEINDTLGHHHGDLLLQQVGERLTSSLRPADTVARLGGDEFVILLPDLSSPASALARAERLVADLEEPFVLENVTLDVQGSFGVAVYPEHGDSFDALLQHADVAMYSAKESRVGVCLYERDQDVNSPRRLALLGELRQAMSDPEQLLLHYQPKVQVGSGAVTGVEALVRWQHPKHGLLGPMEFIPAAERTGLIRPLTIRILETALHQAREWRDAGLPPMRMAVNISTRCLLESDFAEQIQRLLDEAGVSADQLELEITESTIMSDPEKAMVVLLRLAEFGVSLAIDDFGTGYSSLSYLKQLPVHQLKIDRSFVTDMRPGESDEAIVRSSLDLARNLGLDVVAEGVESEATWQHLADLGCDQAQGFFFARPMPSDEIPAWLESWSARVLS